MSILAREILKVSIDETGMQQRNMILTRENERLKSQLDTSRTDLAEVRQALGRIKDKSKKVESELARTRQERDGHSKNLEKAKTMIAQPTKTIRPKSPSDIHVDVNKKKDVTRLKERATEIAKEAQTGLKWPYNSTGKAAADSLVWEYNQLVIEATSLVEADAYIQLLKQIDKEQIPEVAASKVGRLASELELYFTSFESSKALSYTATALIQRAGDGLKWPYNSTGKAAADSLVWEYNYLVRRAKKLFTINRAIQLLEDAPNEKIPNVAAGKVNRLVPSPLNNR